MCMIQVFGLFFIAGNPFTGSHKPKVKETKFKDNRTTGYERTHPARAGRLSSGATSGHISCTDSLLTRNCTEIFQEKYCRSLWCLLGEVFQECPAWKKPGVQTQDTLVKLCLSDGLGMPRFPLRRAGGRYHHSKL